MKALAPTAVTFTAFWLFFLIAGQSKLLRDPGTLWHPIVGDRIIKYGFFDKDPYSYTHGGRHWVPHQWLGEIVMAVAYNRGGWDGLVLLAATLLALLFTVLTLRLYRTGLNFAATAVIAGTALAATSMHLHVRPLLMTTISLAVVMIVLTDCEEQWSWKKLLLLIPLFIAWTNTHGGMLGGLATLGLVLAGWAAVCLMKWPTPINRKSHWLLIPFFIVCGLTMFVTPYGAAIPEAWLSIMRSAKVPQLIEEHQPLDLSKPGAWALFAFAGIYLFVLAGITSKPRVTWLLPLFWLVQSFFRVRHAPLFAVTGMVAIAAIWPSTRWAKWLALKRPDWYVPDAHREVTLKWWWPILLVMVSGLLIVQNVNVPVIGSGWAKLDEERWPVEMKAKISEHRGVKSNPRYFNECEFGGFLIHCGIDQVFIDDRVELYGQDFLEEFVNAGNGDTEAAMNRWNEKFGPPDFALVRPGGAFDQYFIDKGWRRLGNCQAANLYGRPRK